jgi:SAM-dependent methyltransferase
VPDAAFPPGFFDRTDPSPDADFYAPPRLVTHLDDRAVAAVGALYTELGVHGEVLDLMSSWVSHFERPPRRLVGLGLNAAELAANPALAESVVHDLNADPVLPFPDASFDDVTCCVSVDYLVAPVAVFAEVGRVLRPGGRFVVTFSNRCFPTKAIHGWLATDDETHGRIVETYFALSGCFVPATVELRTPPGPGDPLYAGWAARTDRDRDGAGRARNARPRDASGRPLPRGARGVDRVPEDLALPPAQALEQAQHLLDGGYPFQAHEVLEGVWKASAPAERELWRSLAQLAVGLTHLQRDNARGAVALLRRAAAGIGAWDGDPPAGLDLTGLAAHAGELAGRIERSGVAAARPDDLRPRLARRPLDP